MLLFPVDIYIFFYYFIFFCVSSSGLSRFINWAAPGRALVGPWWGPARCGGRARRCPLLHYLGLRDPALNFKINPLFFLSLPLPKELCWRDVRFSPPQRYLTPIIYSSPPNRQIEKHKKKQRKPRPYITSFYNENVLWRTRWCRRNLSSFSSGSRVKMLTCSKNPAGNNP